MKTLPLLDVTMRLKRATDIKLAEAAGVATKTVSAARNGRSIQARLADLICQALFEREFTSTGHVNNWHTRRSHAK